MTDKKEVLRYGMITDHYWGDTIMYPQDKGQWVEWEDYRVLRDKLAKYEAEEQTKKEAGPILDSHGQKVIL